MKDFMRLMMVLTILAMGATLTSLSKEDMSNMDFLVIIAILCFLGIMLRIFQAALFQYINHPKGKPQENAE